LVRKFSIGERLIEAFGTSDKAFIAEKLGFASIQAVYKVINGERELDFERLRRFRDYTNRSIDWLLTGEEPAPPRGFDLERSIERHVEWEPVLREWYDFEGRDYPDLEGVAFMGGWETFTMKQRVAAITDFKALLDKTVAKEKKPGKIAGRIEPGKRLPAEPETNSDIDFVVRGEEKKPKARAKR